MEQRSGGATEKEAALQSMLTKHREIRQSVRKTQPLPGQAPRPG
jgi:hypothetical protein